MSGVSPSFHQLSCAKNNRTEGDPSPQVLQGKSNKKCIKTFKHLAAELLVGLLAESVVVADTLRQYADERHQRP